jgi:hypothetical protein
VVNTDLAGFSDSSETKINKKQLPSKQRSAESDYWIFKTDRLCIAVT